LEINLSTNIFRLGLPCGRHWFSCANKCHWEKGKQISSWCDDPSKFVRNVIDVGG